MTLEQAYYLSQIVAAAAILASLVFLALEVRRNTRETRRAAVEEATSHRTDFVRLLAVDSALMKRVGRGLSGVRLDAAEWMQFSLFLYAIFVEFEVNERRRRDGDLEEELWSAWLDAYRWWLQFPGTRKWWATRPAGFTERFRAIVDAELAKAAPDDRILAQMAKIAAD
jgi:hypothetical protein